MVGFGCTRMQRVMLVGLGAVVLAAGVVPAASAQPGPFREDFGASRKVTVTLVSLYINDDGDKGKACGEGMEETDMMGWLGDMGHLEVQLPPFVEEMWCSDTRYPLPASNPGIQEVMFLQPGTRLFLKPNGREKDFSGFTDFSGLGAVQIPSKGHSAYKTVEAEGSNSHGHVRMTYTYKVTTF